MGQIEYTRKPPLLKLAKAIKSTSSPEPFGIFGLNFACSMSGTLVFQIIYIKQESCPETTHTFRTRCNRPFLFNIISAHAFTAHVTGYFSIIGETSHRWGKRIINFIYFGCACLMRPPSLGTKPYQTHYLSVRCVLRAHVQFCRFDNADATADVQ